MKEFEPRFFLGFRCYNILFALGIFCNFLAHIIQSYFILFFFEQLTIWSFFKVFNHVLGETTIISHFHNHIRGLHKMKLHNRKRTNGINRLVPWVLVSAPPSRWLQRSSRPPWPGGCDFFTMQWA